MCSCSLELAYFAGKISKNRLKIDQKCRCIAGLLWKLQAPSNGFLVPLMKLLRSLKKHKQISGNPYETRDPFLEGPGNLTGPISYFEIKASRIVGCILTSNEVQFVSLADNFTVQFSNLLKLSSGMENKTP